jgi:hypothetical protein
MGAPVGARHHEAKGINTAASLAHKGDGEPISAFTSPGGRGSGSTLQREQAAIRAYTDPRATPIRPALSFTTRVSALSFREFRL